jgi:hypothetical protein
VGENMIKQNLNISKSFLESGHYYKSLLPSVIRDFNSLPPQTQNASTFASFKRLLNNDLPSVPAYFLSGDRKIQIFHTRLRTHCSSLSADLFDKNIIEYPLCVCGARENAYRYFLDCPKYTYFRPELITTISQFCNPSINVILTGITSLMYLFLRLFKNTSEKQSAFIAYHKSYLHLLHLNILDIY